MYENRICFIDDVTILHGAVHLHIGGGDLVFVSEENLKEIKEHLESDEFKSNEER